MRGRLTHTSTCKSVRWREVVAATDAPPSDPFSLVITKELQFNNDGSERSVPEI